MKPTLAQIAILAMIFFLFTACAPTVPQNLLTVTGEVAYPVTNVVISVVTADEAENHPDELYSSDGDQVIYYIVTDLIKIEDNTRSLVVARVDTYHGIDFAGFLVGDPLTYFKVAGPSGAIGRQMQDLCKSTAEAENLGQNCY